MLKNLKNRIQKLSEAENLIIEARISEKPICELEGEKVKWSIDQIVVRTSATFGCELPLNEFFSEIVSDEMQQLLMTMGYIDLNLKEVLLALRFNAFNEIKFPSGVEFEKVIFTGGGFNINFVAKILSNYMQLRNLLDRKFQNLIDGHE